MKQDLKKFFDVVVKHYQLTPEAVKVAWESAKSNPTRATICYVAIANSLKEKKK